MCRRMHWRVSSRGSRIRNVQAIETHKCHATQPNTRQPPAQLTLVQAVDTVLLGLRRGGQVPDHHLQQRVGGGQERLHHALHQGLANQLLVLGLELLQHLRQCEGRGQGAQGGREGRGRGMVRGGVERGAGGQHPDASPLPACPHQSVPHVQADGSRDSGTGGGAHPPPASPAGRRACPCCRSWRPQSRS